MRPETQAGAPCVLKLVSTHEGRQEDLGFQALISWLGGSWIKKQKQQAFSSLSRTETQERGDGCAESLNTLMACGKEYVPGSEANSLQFQRLPKK